MSGGIDPASTGPDGKQLVYIGLDFGVSQNHPTALIECYLDDGPDKAIYVRRESERVAQNLRVYMEMMISVPESPRVGPSVVTTPDPKLSTI